MKNLILSVVIIFSSIFVGAQTSNRTERLINRNIGFNTKKSNNKQEHSFKNYLNYRDVYGIRYIPSDKKITKNPIDNEINDKDASNGSKTEEEHLLTSIESENTSNFMSSEILSNSIESTTVQGINFTLNNFFDDEYEPEIEGTNSHHIMNMKPNNRYEHALNFLASRMKSLLYYSNDHTRPESQMVPPHLISLGKILNLFSKIRFDNGPCVAGQKPMRQLSGSCMNEAECLNFGGISMNRCANGLGACCIFKSSCGTVTHQNVTYFESPNFPFASPANLGSCTLTILLSKDVKQVLLEFQFFELLPPKDGDCIDDQFIISTEWGGLSHEIPILCGTATGQHLYIEVNGFEKLFLSVLTHQVEERAFSIKITQLRAHDRLAPAGCLQFFTESEGIIKSFNYDDDYSKFPYRIPSYFNNMNYAICIRRKEGYCRIFYTNELQGREDVFQLLNTDANGNFLAENQAGAEIFSCPQDFIAVNYIRLCGSKLNDGSISVNFNQNAPVRSYMNGPIVIPVKSDNQTVGRGFKLYYFQEKCLE